MAMPLPVISRRHVFLAVNVVLLISIVFVYSEIESFIPKNDPLHSYFSIAQKLGAAAAVLFPFLAALYHLEEKSLAAFAGQVAATFNSAVFSCILLGALALEAAGLYISMFHLQKVTFIGPVEGNVYQVFEGSRTLLGAVPAGAPTVYLTSPNSRCFLFVDPKTGRNVDHACYKLDATGSHGGYNVRFAVIHSPLPLDPAAGSRN
jgi:hypothetical protein